MLNQNISFLKNILSYQIQNKIFLIKLGNIEINILEKLKDDLLSLNINKELEYITLNDNIEFQKNNNACYVLAQLGSIKSSDILFLKKNIELLNIPLKGMIILD